MPNVTIYHKEVEQLSQLNFDANTTTLELITETFPEETDLMVRIAQCESGIRQFDSEGNVIRSHTNDVGLFQINVATWATKAEELGYDIYSTQGNLQMARYVYENQGVSAWVCYRIINK